MLSRYSRFVGISTASRRSCGDLDPPHVDPATDTPGAGDHDTGEFQGKQAAEIPHAEAGDDDGVQSEKQGEGTAIGHGVS